MLNCWQCVLFLKCCSFFTSDTPDTPYSQTAQFLLYLSTAVAFCCWILMLLRLLPMLTFVMRLQIRFPPDFLPSRYADLSKSLPDLVLSSSVPLMCHFRQWIFHPGSTLTCREEPMIFEFSWQCLMTILDLSMQVLGCQTFCTFHIYCLFVFISI